MDESLKSHRSDKLLTAPYDSFPTALAGTGIASVPSHLPHVQKGDVERPHCRSGFRRIEVSSMKDRPGEYRCPFAMPP